MPAVKSFPPGHNHYCQGDPLIHSGGAFPPIMVGIFTTFQETLSAFLSCLTQEERPSRSFRVKLLVRFTSPTQDSGKNMRVRIPSSLALPHFDPDAAQSVRSIGRLTDRRTNASPYLSPSTQSCSRHVSLGSTDNAWALRQFIRKGPSPAQGQPRIPPCERTAAFCRLEFQSSQELERIDGSACQDSC